LSAIRHSLFADLGHRKGYHVGTAQSPHEPAPILPPLGPTQLFGRENKLGAAEFACLRACGKKYILAATEHTGALIPVLSVQFAAGPVLPMEMS
jgi:hypothetical protein